MRRSIRVLLAGTTLALAIGMMGPSAYADAGLKLRPGSFGSGTEGAWKSKEGRPDSKGNARHALYLQKFTTTPTVAAAYAVVDNVEGTAVSQLTGLSWEHRTDGHCGAGAPRWNVVVRGSDGDQYFLFLGCAAATHGLTSDPTNWVQDSYSSPTLVNIGLTNRYGAAFAAAHEAAVSAGTIEQLYILFDEGTDIQTGGMIAAAGFVYLDNITVTLNGVPKVFTGPMDNGNH